MREHAHNGFIGGQISILNLLDFIPTVDTAPTHTPRTFIDQFRIYSNGTTYRFYWYDGTAKAWRFVPSSGLSGTKVYYVADTSGGAVTRKLTFVDGILTSET